MTQLTRDDLRRMTPEQIVTAHKDGQLDSLLGMPTNDVELLERARDGKSLTRDDIKRLAQLGEQDLIIAAHESGVITEGNQK